MYAADRCLVFAGATESHAGEIHYVKKVHVHPKYKGGGDNHLFHDISMIELKDHLTLDSTKQTLTIAGKDDVVKTGDDVFVSGWGTNPEHPDDDRLYQVHLKVISAQKCHDELTGGNVEEVEKHQICAYDKNKAHCHGKVCSEIDFDPNYLTQKFSRRLRRPANSSVVKAPNWGCIFWR